MEIISFWGSDCSFFANIRARNNSLILYVFCFQICNISYTVLQAYKTHRLILKILLFSAASFALSLTSEPIPQNIEWIHFTEVVGAQIQNMDCSSLSLAFCDKPSEKTAHQENFQRLEQCSKKTVDFSYTTILCRWSQICQMCSYLVLDTQCQQHHSVSIIFYESYLSQALQVSYNIA